jgi:nicotinamidase-related amidase
MELAPINLTETALVLIDLQRGIVGRQTAPHSASDVVRNAATLVRRFREAQAAIVLVRVGFSLDGRDMLKLDVDEPMMRGPLPPDWMEPVPEMQPEATDIVIIKRHWGAFTGTELDLQLRRRGIKRIVLGGIATNFGVESTARSANELGYHQIFAEDAITSLHADAHAFSVRTILPRLGLVRSTREILDACAADAKGQ